jgi:hypothetical protein
MKNSEPMFKRVWSKVIIPMIKSNISVIVSPSVICEHCKTEMAEIYQESGDYSLNCWQEKIYPVF